MPFVGQNENRKSGILKIPAAFLFLGGVEGSTQTYVLEFGADIQTAYAYQALSVSVRAYINNPTINYNTLSGDTPMGLVGNAIAMSGATIASRLFNKKRSQILATKIDLTNAINNSGLASAKNGVSRALLYNRVYLKLADQKPVERSKRTRRADRSALPRMTIPDRPLADPLIRSSRMMGVIASNEDPLSVFNDSSYSFPLEPPELRLQSQPPGNYVSTRSKTGASRSNRILRSVRPRVDPGVFRRMRPRPDSDNPKAKVLSSFIAANAQSIPQLVEMYKAKQVVVPFEVPVRFSVDQSVLENMSRVYFEFKLMSVSGLVVDRIVKTINVSEIINEANLSLLAPTLGARRTADGNVHVKITQNDPGSIAVDLYRREIDLSRESNKADTPGWKKITTVNCNMQKHGYFFDRGRGSTMTYMYRAIAISPSGVKSNIFGSSVVGPLNLTNPSIAPPCMRSCHNNRGISVVPDVRISVVPERSGNSVKVRVDGQTTNVRKFEIVFKDLSNGARIYTQLFYRKPVGYVHDSCADGHTYEYKVRCFLSDGTETWGKSKITHRFMKFNPGKIKGSLKTRLSPMQRVNNPRNARVHITTRAQETEEQFSSILQSMSSQMSAMSSFSAQIEEMKPRLSELMRVDVVRKDLTTGVEESFGPPMKLGNFVDGETTRMAAGISHLRPGHEYEYEFSLSKVSISNFLGNVKFSEEDETRLLKFDKDESRFGTDGRGKSNTLKSSADLKRVGGAGTGANRSGLANLFSQNITPIRTVTRVELPEPKITIGNVTANFNERSRMVTVTWQTDSYLDIIDSFIVMADVQGVKAPVGAVMPTTETTRSYAMRDTVLGDVIGDRIYSIIPVYNNFSIGEESGSPRVRISNNLSYLEEVN